MYVGGGGVREYFDLMRRAPPGVVRSYLNQWCGVNVSNCTASSVVFTDITAYTFATV